MILLCSLGAGFFVVVLLWAWVMLAAAAKSSRFARWRRDDDS